MALRTLPGNADQKPDAVNVQVDVNRGHHLNDMRRPVVYRLAKRYRLGPSHDPTTFKICSAYVVSAARFSAS